MADNIFEVELPDGRILEVEGAPSEDAARTRARSFLQEERRAAPRTGSSFARGVDELQGNLYSAAEGAGRLTGLQFLEQFGRSGRERNEREAEASQPRAQQQSFEDAETAGDYFRAASQALGTNLPNMGASLAAGAAGAAAGSIIPGVGTLAGGLMGALAVNYPQLFGSNRQRQMQENPNQPVDEGAAALTAIPQAALDTVSDRVLLGLGRVLGRPAEEVGRTLLPRIARGLGIGAATEVPTEVLQQALERGQAGLDVLSDDAMREYREIALATAVTGGAAGGTMSGAFGARPNQQISSPTNTDQTTSTPALQRVAEPLPEEPAPVETIEEARQILEANPQFAAPEGTSDAGRIERANDVVRAAYRDVVYRTRQAEVNDWIGANNIARQPGELDEDGNATADTLDVARAAPIFIRNILNARGSGELTEGRFTVDQVANLAVARLGLTSSALSRAEKNSLRQTLNAYAAAGYLEPAGKNAFTIAARPEVRPEAERRSQQANPRTAEDRAVNPAIAALGEVVSNPTSENIGAVRRLVAGTQLQEPVNKFLELNLRLRQLQQQRRALAQTPQNAEAFAEIDQQSQEAAQEMAAVVDQLEGRAAGTIAVGAGPEASPAGYIAGAPVETVTPPDAQFTQQVGRSVPNAASPWAQAAEQYKAQQQAAAIAVNDDAFIADLIANRPQEALELVQSLITGRPPGSSFNNSVIRQAAEATGLGAISPQVATNLYDVARANNLINGLGFLPREAAPRETPRPNIRQTSASVPPIGGPQAQRTWQSETPVAPVVDNEMTESNQALLRDYGATESEIRNYVRDNDTRWRNQALRRARAGMIWWNGQVQKATQKILDEANSGFVALQQEAIRQVATMNRQFAGATENESRNLQPIFGSDAGSGTRAQAMAHINSRLNDRRYTIARIQRQMERATNTPEGQYGATDMPTSNEPNARFDDEREAGDPGFVGRMSETGAITDTDMNVAQQAAEETWNRVLGSNGRLELRDRIFLDELDAETQKAAADAGINHVEGLALQDLAILSLRDRATPITDLAVHEGWHVAENIGLITPNEIALLNANLDQIRKVILQHYPDVTEYDLTAPNEVRAYGLNARIIQRADFGGTVNKIYDKVVNFVERIGNFMRGQGFQTWRDVYDAFNAGGMRGRTPTNPRDDALVGFVRAPAPTTQKVQQATVDQIRGPLKWFGSPILTMSKKSPELRAVADTQKTLYTRSNEMINEVTDMLEAAHKLSPESVTKITRVWETASRTRKAPVTTNLTAEERTALQGEMQAVQRGFDYFIEASAIQHFMPNAKTLPAVRAKLDALWQRHAGKHLWEIPQRELMAASPEGYAEMQKLERLRNPYYMPMVGRGSHFVAAYKAGPNGQRGELVGMVAYSPRNMIQKMRKFSDPEADAIAQLQAEFSGPKYVVMTEGRQFTNDAQANSVREQGDFVAQYLSKLAAASGNNTDAQRIIREMTTQIDKAQMGRIFRPNNNILRAITPQNESSYILDVMPQYTLSMAKIQARRFTQEPFKNAIAPLSPGDQQFANDMRDYATTPTEAFGGFRALAFFWYLGGALDTAAVNALQGVNTITYLTRDGGVRGTAVALKTAKELMLSTNADQILSNSTHFLDRYRKGLPPAERTALDRAISEGIFSPVFTSESRSQFTIDGLRKAGFKNAEQWQKRANFVSRIAGTPMQWVEEYNRAVAFMGALRLANEDPSVITKSNHVDKTDHKSAYDYAVGKVIETQYLTTKEDRAYIQRFTPAAELMTQFLSYPLKTLEQYATASMQIIRGMAQHDMVMAKAGFITLVGTTMPLVALAGVWALPFADSLREWLEAGVGFLWGSTQNFDADLREMLGGGQFAEAVVRGIPHATGVASLSRRLAIDPLPAGDLMGGSMIAMMGPAAGILEQPARAYQYYNNGDYWQMAAALMPRAAGNVVRGLQLGIDQEQYTLRGNRVITPQMVEQHGTVNAALSQMWGFPPPEFVNEREIVSRTEEVNRSNRIASERLNKELSGYLLQVMEANQRGDSTSSTNAMRRFNERLTESLREDEARPVHLRRNPQMRALQRRAINDFYGAGSEQTTGRGRRQAREEVARQRGMLDWRNQPE